MSPYEKDLQNHFQEKLSAHLKKSKVLTRLKRTGNVKKEVIKYAKRYDKKYFTQFYKVLKKGL